MNLPTDIIKLIARKLDKWSLFSFTLINPHIYKILYTKEFLLGYLRLEQDIGKLFRRYFYPTAGATIIYPQEKIVLSKWGDTTLWDLRSKINSYFTYTTFTFIVDFSYRGQGKKISFIHRPLCFTYGTLHFSGKSIYIWENVIQIRDILQLLMATSITNREIDNLIINITAN